MGDRDRMADIPLRFLRPEHRATASPDRRRSLSAEHRIEANETGIPSRVLTPANRRARHHPAMTSPGSEASTSYPRKRRLAAAGRPADLLLAKCVYLAIAAPALQRRGGAILSDTADSRMIGATVSSPTRSRARDRREVKSDPLADRADRSRRTRR